MTWETTKIKSDVKEDAKEESYTFSELMQLGVMAVRNDLTARNEDGSVSLEAEPEQSREELIEDITEQLETLEETKDQISMANEPGVEIEAQKLIDRLDELQAEVEQAKATTERIESEVNRIPKDQ